MNGVLEKDVVLAIAKKLANLINKESYMRAVLTRNGDYYLPLRERLKLARNEEADIFIAIHADAHFDNHAKGASVYILSARGASTEAARWLAQRENYSEIGDVEFNDLQDQSPMLRSVLIDLAQTTNNRNNVRLGDDVLDELEKVTKLHYARAERAPFIVLKSLDIPSILVETGFISNKQEEKRLQDPVQQEKLASALWLGIKKYSHADLAAAN